MNVNEYRAGPAGKSSVMRPVEGRKANGVYRIREHLTEAEINKLLASLKRNRHGHRDWLIALLIYRHGLRVSEACDLRWDESDQAHHHRTQPRAALTAAIIWNEMNWLASSCSAQQADTSAYAFINERGEPFGRMGIPRMIERAGEAARLPFPIHVHMLRHSTGYALAARGMDTRRLQHYLGHASITNTVRYTAMSHRSHSRTSGAKAGYAISND